MQARRGFSHFGCGDPRGTLLCISNHEAGEDRAGFHRKKSTDDGTRLEWFMDSFLSKGEHDDIVNGARWTIPVQNKQQLPFNAVRV